MALIGEMVVDYLTSKTSTVWKLNKNMSFETIKTLMKRGYIFRESATKKQFVLGANGLFHFTDDAILFNDTIFIGDMPKNTTSSGTTNTTNVQNPIYAECDQYFLTDQKKFWDCKISNGSIWGDLNVTDPINEIIVKPIIQTGENISTGIDEIIVKPVTQWGEDVQTNIEAGLKSIQDGIDAGLIKTQADFDKFVSDSQLNLKNLGAGFEAFKLQAQQNLDNALSFGDDIKKYGLIAGVGIGVLVLILVLKK